jgi:hypothetical protein
MLKHEPEKRTPFFLGTNIERLPQVPAEQVPAQTISCRQIGFDAVEPASAKARNSRG